jgi:hypothetical protein
MDFFPFLHFFKLLLATALYDYAVQFFSRIQVNMGCFGAEHMDWLFGTMDHWVRDGGEHGYLEKRGISTAAAESKEE